MRVLFVFCFAFSSLFSAHDGCGSGHEYAFQGKHFLASYCECDPEALQDIAALERVMHEGVEASGATILGTTMHVFPPDGLTMVILLSESHASIHLYDGMYTHSFRAGRKCRSCVIVFKVCLAHDMTLNTSGHA
ncbi:MAG: S-adenosylmethionine decarboxylase proenzyme [Chlamydiae bacterium]|nr:S-adenosylmethionine decarboxylase proenzyme [Chlamydiota bacterium]